MTLMEPAASGLPLTSTEERPGRTDQPLQARILRCRCGFQMDAPGTVPGLPGRLTVNQ